MDSKAPVSAAMVMLVVAVFVLGGLTGYIAGTNHGAVAAASMPSAGAPPAGMCPMGGKSGETGSAASLMSEAKMGMGKATGDPAGCPMMNAKAKAQTQAPCPMGGEKGQCAKHPNCPDAGKCATPAAKGAAAKPGTCPMGAKGACDGKCGDGDKCSMKPAAKAPAKTTVAAKATYVCPMCPGVTSDKPGKCPKCGMNLVLKK